jgi:hypothetical protein
MNHCSEFGYELWASAQNDAIQYRPVMISSLWAIVQEVQDLQDLLMRWVKAQDLDMAKRNSIGFSYALEAIAQYLVLHYEPQRQTNYSSAESQQIFIKA